LNRLCSLPSFHLYLRFHLHSCHFTGFWLLYNCL
jgi:hypothetical protein